MSALTPRFGFSYFGGSTQGTITDDGQKFTSLDPLTLDRLLAAVEVHDHHYRPQVGVSAIPPTAGLLTDAGALPGGYTYFYRYSVVDAQGAESVASAELTVVTPGLLMLPGMPDATVDDALSGSLSPGLYYYALTAIRGTEETPLGSATLISLQAGDTTVTLTLPAFGDADSVRVWRMGSTEAGYTSLAIVEAGTTSWTDDGSIAANPWPCAPGSTPPQSNTGTSSYAVDITLPVDVDLTSARAWRLYRTVYPGIYPTTSLVHEVVERGSEWDPDSDLMRTWRDRGGPMTSGKPMDTDLNMRFQAYTFDTVDSLPDPAGYPADYPLIFDGALYAKIDGAWTPLGGGSGGGGMSVIMTAPAGSRFSLSIDEAGALVTTPTLMPGPPAAVTDMTVVEDVLSWTTGPDGGAPVTGFVARAYDGVHLVESHLAADITTLDLPAELTAVSICARNQFGEGSAVELAV